MLSLFNGGRFREAADLARKMATRFPALWLGWSMSGMALQRMGRSAEALAPMQKAARLTPGDAGAQNNLGTVFQDLGRLTEAETAYRRALQLEPGFAQAHINLGSILHESGKLDEAEASYRQALKTEPNHIGAHYNLGGTLRDLGRLDEAEASYRQTLRIDPHHIDAYRNLAATLQDRGRDDEAEACYRQALTLAPNYTGALNNLALLLTAQGKPEQGLELIRRSLRIDTSAEAKRIFATCLKQLHITRYDEELHATMVHALTEPWGNPGELGRVAIDLVKLAPGIAALQEPLNPSGINTLSVDSLLCALLEVTPVCDIDLERLLTSVRRALLDAANSTQEQDVSSLRFHSALAQQCFINEYVFSCGDDELDQARAQRDALNATLDAATPVSPIQLLAVASYFPLETLALANRLLDREWPAPVQAVLMQQIGEPAAERGLRASIPCLTDINDEISLLVQNQYEEHPYPRWIKAPPAVAAKDVLTYLRTRFPLSPFQPGSNRVCTDVLIAGCGTGLHPINAVQHTRGAKILAIDLSMSSLAYAKRKTIERGLTSIEYAQADLLKLGASGLRFDVIESSGVLHHLADPWQGWNTLLALLRPGGFMKLGFYSESARRNIVRIRDIIARRGYGSTAEDIRRCRQELIHLDEREDFGNTVRSPDFFSSSACRDLLFHVQEHRMTLPDISAFLSKNALRFLGFEIDANILSAYRKRFPEDDAATDLKLWHRFESEHPDTFSGMYQFWIQKQGDQP